MIPKFSLKDGVIIGGPDNSMLTIAKSLSNQGKHLAILAGFYSKEDVIVAKRIFDWAKIYSIPIIRNTTGLVRGIEVTWKIPSYLQKQRATLDFDLLHAHSGYLQLGFLTSLAGKILKIPTVHTLYSAVTSEFEDRRSVFLRPELAKHYFSNVDRIIAISNNIKNALIEVGIPKTKIKWIPPAIDGMRFHPSLSVHPWRQKLGLQKFNPMILYVGNLTKTKGLDLLVEAMHQIIQKWPRTKLALAMQQQHKRFKKRRLEIENRMKVLGIADNIIEVGPVKDMPHLMAACDVFVSPLRSTNGLADYPISILEAMAVGKPVVVTKVGGVPELVSHMQTGLIVEPGNVELLANQIHFALENREIVREMGTNAAEFIKQQFSVERVRTMTEEVYLDLV